MFLKWIELTLQTMLLGIEAQSVIGLRMRTIAYGGPAALLEVQGMVDEKITAFTEAGTTLFGGGSARTVICRYRHHVQANEHRLLESERRKAPYG
jgi:hypothetical protein